jgi:chemotaxis protein CheZ
MASEADDLEALFDSIAYSQEDGSAAPPAEAPATTPAPAAGTAESPEDELEALFDSIADSHRENVVSDDPMPASSPAPQNDAVVTEAVAKSADTADDLYAAVGRCTRHLHDAMRELGYDQSLMQSTTEMSSARDRLEYVADLTEKAAVKVLNAVDEGLPEEDKLLKESKTLTQAWDRMFEGKLSVEEFKTLAEQSRQFAMLAAQTAERQKARMMEIMMAQDFQDITGQIIKKIVNITQAHEQELMKILRENAPEHLPQRQDDKPVDLLQGPDVPRNALAQDDVDNLLADLGF